MATLSVYESVLKILTDHNVSYQLFEHEPVITSEDAARVRGTDLLIGAKAIIMLADKKPILLVLSGSKKINMKAVKQCLGVKDLQMMPREQVEAQFGVQVGGVPPFGVAMGIPTYLDEAFTKNETMDFNVGRRDRSVEIRVSDYRTVVEPTIFPFAE